MFLRTVGEKDTGGADSAPPPAFVGLMIIGLLSGSISMKIMQSPQKFKANMQVAHKYSYFHISVPLFIDMDLASKACCYCIYIFTTHI